MELERSKYLPMYKIERTASDTLFLFVNPLYKKGNNRTYWVRFPKNEFGHYDLIWNDQNSDSLKWKYDRRRYKFCMTKYGELYRYDSLLKAGYFKWSVKDYEKQNTETINQ